MKLVRLLLLIVLTLVLGCSSTPPWPESPAYNWSVYPDRTTDQISAEMKREPDYISYDFQPDFDEIWYYDCYKKSSAWKEVLVTALDSYSPDYRAETTKTFSGSQTDIYRVRKSAPPSPQYLGCLIFAFKDKKVQKVLFRYSNNRRVQLAPKEESEPKK